jgi:molybdate transport system substrate-binding protein
MEKLYALMPALILTLSMTACGSSTVSDADAAEDIELIIFAAASMTEALEEIAGLYANAESNVRLIFNFDSSGVLRTQIQEGARADIFISAAQMQMDQLEEQDFVLPGSRIDILENRVALVVPEENKKNINSFEDMAAALVSGDILMAMGNSDVPVGQYTQRILAYFDLDEQALANSGALTYGSNVKQVATQVIEASVDCGVVYLTDAFSAGLKAVDRATAEMCGQVIYPAAVLNASNRPEAAKAFLDFLTGSEAIAVFESVGFSPVYR